MINRKIILAPESLGSISEFCAMNNLREMQRLCNTYDNNGISLNEAGLATALDYIGIVEKYYRIRYPNWDSDEQTYDPEHENSYLDGLDEYKNHLVYALADAFGTDIFK